MQSRILKRNAEKQALIRRLSAEGRSLLFFYDEAPPADIPHEQLSDGMTLVHPPYEYASLQRWLDEGNWQAIYPAHDSYCPLDTFRSPAADVERSMQAAKLDLLVDSFYDDTEWNVFESAGSGVAEHSAGLQPEPEPAGLQADVEQRYFTGRLFRGVTLLLGALLLGVGLWLGLWLAAGSWQRYLAGAALAVLGADMLWSACRGREPWIAKLGPLP